ncbi:MAG: hypothetical protein UR66_C0003G0025 [Candidatus Moranbacteria bacterium GW2011_GWE1_35_17]|nr:MAG: hypothetical protein UR66_C0003G0025 [Candidatus Moranbacteria bacterium GW2011_GWE1_35_17]KKP82951.1 MAG: hypothetical protein UR82_C0027G0025 [Candidatus Moranbacteria bacterium GW2011_GWF1_35_5]HBR79005.1 hypothetical protein [Candidatus Moranbacteria bacterium]
MTKNLAHPVIAYTCGHCKKLYIKNNQGEQFYLPTTNTDPRIGLLYGVCNDCANKTTAEPITGYNIFCSYCEMFYGKFLNGEKTYSQPQKEAPLIIEETSHGICPQCYEEGAFEKSQK